MTRTPHNLPSLPQNLVEAAVRSALDEDLGLAGDITTNATVAPDALAEAVIAARKPGVVAGHQGPQRLGHEEGALPSELMSEAREAIEGVGAHRQTRHRAVAEGEAEFFGLIGTGRWNWNWHVGPSVTRSPGASDVRFTGWPLTCTSRPDSRT